MTSCRTENALFSSEHVIQIRESTSCVHVLSLVLIPSSTNRRVHHFHPTRYLSHLSASIFYCRPLRKIITQRNFLSLRQNNSEGFIGAPLILFQLYNSIHEQQLIKMVWIFCVGTMTQFICRLFQHITNFFAHFFSTLQFQLQTLSASKFD